MNPLIKNFILAFLILLIISAIFSLFFQPTEGEKQITLNQVAEDIGKDKIDKISISGNNLEIFYKDGQKAKAAKESEIALSQSLLNYGVSPEKLRGIKIEPQQKQDFWTWLGPVLYLLPTLFLFFFFWLIFRQAKSGTSQVFDFTRAKARIFGPGGQLKERVTFNDVGGLKEAKEELEEIVDFLKNPKKYLEIGAKIPRGVLLMGAPGTGKTLLAKAIAFTADVPFFSISASEVIELFVGVGSARIRSLFEQARKTGKAIIFIDEIDSIGKVRGVGVTGGHEEREQTLNQLLAEMDGIGREEGILVFAATNRPEYLDPALLRPGRFDRRIVLDLPDINEREEILKIHCRGKPLAPNINLKEVATRTPGFSGADLANVVNEAAILAARRDKNQISQEEILESIEKVLLGPERKSHILSNREKEIVAYHEAGHALVASFLKEAEEVRKVSIVARGLAAGYTLKMPTEERKIKTKPQFLAELSTLLGGYTAEKIKFREISTGGGDDLKKASELARKLVKEYGMSSLGPITFGEKEELIFLGREVSEQRNYSEKIAIQIDEEVEKFIKNAQNQAEKILLQKKKLLNKVAQTLIQKETIEKEEFENLIKKKSQAKPEIKIGKLRSLKVKKIK